MKILIVGGSKGLGKYLASNIHNAEIYMIARTEQNDERISSFSIDVNPEKKPDYSCLKSVKFDIVVYLVSMWGESSNLTTVELADFMNVGPLGYLNLVNELHSQESLSEKCSIVSIGSTAELSDSTQYPAFTLSKKLLKDVSGQLQNIHHCYRFTHFTIGGIGQGEEERIEYFSVLEIINTLVKMDSNTYISSMLIKSKLGM
ncbi:MULTISPECIES: hypothetical protein [Vibrio harveyi group]|uniref:Short-chain dehydrogenase n=1 Tax=Vibrio campbellii TaxID=680 RepID=A0ABY5IJ13_9VIBR|nr:MULTISPECIES: hypothetical protein [Vibrio harveyi group]MCU8506123.1 hypothetical protein [Vibrio vulnificus]ARV72845.1 hypothetical protein A8140_09025 [Vibrio campbellii CAIM 519 = NBRC 15631 = ATCC 25920]ARV74552.1 hypothetical protein A8140_18060 [Vibrio campbellii CAIM 519 = NBRC 15631 = ATCC 25920]ELU49238.1 hypothetical protein B878_24400 [Vibrio campbellii CAIM 519 = NBRC 15631 = ATCC 25920]MCS0456092.1 hypothetical protein [Vibrio diabolicus]